MAASAGGVHLSGAGDRPLDEVLGHGSSPFWRAVVGHSTSTVRRCRPAVMRHSPHGSRPGPGGRRYDLRHGGLGRPAVGPVGRRSPSPPTSASGSRRSTCSVRRGSACASASGWAWTPRSSPPSTTSASSPTSGARSTGTRPPLLFGDDIDFRADAVEVDLAGFPAMVFMLRRAGSGTSAFNRARQAAALMASGGARWSQQMASHCSAAGALANRLGLGDDVRAGVEQAYARWDGRGVPGDLSGTSVSLAARDLARRRGVRGVPPHGRARGRRRRGPLPERHPLRPGDRRGWSRPIPSRLFEDLDRGHRRRGPRRRARRATAVDR